MGCTYRMLYGAIDIFLKNGRCRETQGIGKFFGDMTDHYDEPFTSKIRLPSPPEDLKIDYAL
jgi:hypothetical protein